MKTDNIYYEFSYGPKRNRMCGMLLHDGKHDFEKTVKKAEELVDRGEENVMVSKVEVKRTSTVVWKDGEHVECR